MSIKKSLLAILFISFLLIGPSIAHEWYPPLCCSGNDCHPIPCESIQEQGRNLVYKGFQFYDTMIKPSLDGACHVCISNESGADNYNPVPHCIFIQSNS